MDNGVSGEWRYRDYGPFWNTRLRQRQLDVRCLVEQEMRVEGAPIHAALLNLGWKDEWGFFFV